MRSSVRPDLPPEGGVAAGSDMPDYARELAGFAAGLTLDRVPAEVVARAKLNILDAVGIGLASVGYDYAAVMAAALADIGGAGDYPVLGMDLRLGQRDAVHLNGTLIHGLDFDDTHSGAVVHTSASAVPVMLAAGRAAGASGARALTAFIVASECSSRIGVAANGGFHEKGFHPTGVVGAFGSALGAGHLHGLSVDQLRDAQGVVLSMAAGSLEFLEDGAWTKRNHPGWAGACALTAIAMAKHGFFGPRRGYDGRFGLYRLYTRDDREIDLGRLGQDLGSRWEMLNIAFKPYPACHLTHAFADAVLALAREHDLRADDVAAMTAFIADAEVPVVCEPEANKKRPQNSYDAQFSLHYVMAASLLRGQFTLAELEPEAVADPAILELCGRIGYAPDPHSAYPIHYSGEVEVVTRDGRRLRHREQVNRGAAENPLSAEDLKQKFLSNATRTVSPERAERILAAVLDLENCPRVTDLDALLAGAA